MCARIRSSKSAVSVESYVSLPIPSLPCPRSCRDYRGSGVLQRLPWFGGPAETTVVRRSCRDYRGSEVLQRLPWFGGPAETTVVRADPPSSIRGDQSLR